MSKRIFVGLSLLICSVCFTNQNEYTFTIDDQVFCDNDPVSLMKNGECSYIYQNYEEAILFLEKSLYLLELEPDLLDYDTRYRCLYSLFLSYAELRCFDMMVLVGQKATEILSYRAQTQYASFKNQQNTHFNLCSDRPDPPDYERGGCLNERDAQDHYDRAYNLALEAVGHAMNAGITIEYLPISIYETYRSVECFKEAAREYNIGVEKEKRGNGK